MFDFADQATTQTAQPPLRTPEEHRRLQAAADAEPRAKHWRETFVRSVSLLQEDSAFPGAEGAFEQALTNGLLAVAVAENPALLSAKSLPPASKLIIGLSDIPEVQTAALGEAVKRTGAARHGRGAGGVLQLADVQALAKLDDHPALSGLRGELVDKLWVKATLADRYELDRAATYLGLFDHDEIERRANYARTALTTSMRPRDQEPGPQECPVCERETMNHEGGDDFGYGYTAGTCLVCSYRRSDEAAYEAGSYADLRRHMERD